ncbi:hypothetical protein [Ewingella americana]|uniref:hypothetical protein n=1 Tax=Ewingella americana TaxID=41202 RepID=UPI0016395AA5|nr:hypothetical protein [Ewingella americana]QMV50120.1 hypothetical protein GXP68_01190 [Ewingella americana]
MKELSIVEMNEVSGAGWNIWKGAGVGLLTGVMALAIHSANTDTPINFKGKDANFVIDTTTLLGALAGTMAEYHGK